MTQTRRCHPRLPLRKSTRRVERPLEYIHRVSLIRLVKMGERRCCPTKRGPPPRLPVQSGSCLSEMACFELATSLLHVLGPLDACHHKTVTHVKKHVHALEPHQLARQCSQHHPASNARFCGRSCGRGKLYCRRGRTSHGFSLLLLRHAALGVFVHSLRQREVRLGRNSKQGKWSAGTNRG